MTNQIAARLYLLFALLLLVLCWKFTQGTGEALRKVQAQQAAQLEKALAAYE